MSKAASSSFLARHLEMFWVCWVLAGGVKMEGHSTLLWVDYKLGLERSQFANSRTIADRYFPTLTFQMLNGSCFPVSLAAFISAVLWLNHKVISPYFLTTKELLLPSL